MFVYKYIVFFLKIESEIDHHFRDLAVLRPDGYGQIVGRIKDLIIRGGENVYPAEVENRNSMFRISTLS